LLCRVGGIEFEGSYARFATKVRMKIRGNTKTLKESILYLLYAIRNPKTPRAAKKENAS